ncbi:MAG: hypothetical protein Q9227_003153 [Pyrenula ochraceoflavens]
MDSNPNEVVTVLLVNSNDNSTSSIASSFTSSGISKYAYTPQSTTPTTTWPTLQSLISSNHRLITFVASLSQPDSSAPYLLNEFDYVFENPFEVTSPSNFSCSPDRPSQVSSSVQSALSSNRLPLMNHFLDTTQAFGIEVPDINNINTTNSPSSTTVGALGQALSSCTEQYGNRAPTFVLVDFFDQGPAVQAVDAANGVSSTVVGRKPVPARQEQAAADGAAVGMSVSSNLALVMAVIAVVGMTL